MAKSNLRKVSVSTLPNGYSLKVDGKEYMYFNMMDCWTYGVRHYIGILYIDSMLNSLYNKIAFCAEQQEIELPMHF